MKIEAETVTFNPWIASRLRTKKLAAPRIIGTPMSYIWQTRESGYGGSAAGHRQSPTGLTCPTGPTVSGRPPAYTTTPGELWQLLNAVLFFIFPNMLQQTEIKFSFSLWTGRFVRGSDSALVPIKAPVVPSTP